MLIILSILIILCVVIGASYAYWRLVLSQTGENEVASSCFSITLTNEQNAINLQKAYPILDEEGKKLTPYTFTVKNNCDAYASYSVNLELLETILEENRLSSGFIKVMLDENAPLLLTENTSIEPTLDNAYEAYELATGYLDKNEEVTYNLRLWMDQDVTIEDDAMNKQLESKITIAASYVDHIPTDYERCVEEYGEDSIQCSIIANVDTTGKCPTVNEDGTVNVTNVEDTESLVCSAPDDYGTSYYYRGAPENNWVKFADFYWRILRINGDGSIRMIYAGDADVIDALPNKEEVLANGYNDSETKYTQIGTSVYNYYGKKDNIASSYFFGYYDNAGVGYMYGNRDDIVEGNTLVGTITHSNTTTRYYADNYKYNLETNQFTLENPVEYIGAEITSDFIGKYTIDSTSSTSSDKYVFKVTSITTGSGGATIGYSYVTYGTTSKEAAQENINDSNIKTTVDSWYEKKILGTEYEQYISDTLFCNDRSLGSNTSPSYSQLGYGTEQTKYRWYSSDNGIKLTCAQQNDRFTVNDEVVGNGDLTHSVGLLTNDEAYLAGVDNTENNNYYLYTGNSYWTMSPKGFFGILAYVNYSNSLGLSFYDSTNSSLGVRPVINLKPNRLKSGDGTALNPYTVEENM